MEIDNWWKEDEPKYLHDCANCKFLGLWVGSPKDIRDLYICIHKKDASLIARYGNDGSDYWSAPLGVAMMYMYDPKMEYVHTAFKRAIQEKLLTPEMALFTLETMV